MNTQKKDGNKNKGSAIPGVAIAVVILLGAALNSNDEIVTVILGIALITFIAIVIAVTAAKNKKAQAVGSKRVHTHDRLDTSVSAYHCSTQEQHWKEQLDGFLAAGLIDRKEYKILWEKHHEDFRNFQQ